MFRMSRDRGGKMLIICLSICVAAIVEVAVRRRLARVTQQRRAALLDDVTKELTSWDRTKELGFNDVLFLEGAYQKATGALPEGSKTKELAEKTHREIQQQMELMRGYANGYRPGEVLRYQPDGGFGRYRYGPR